MVQKGPRTDLGLWDSIPRYRGPFSILDRSRFLLSTFWTAKT